MERTCARCSGPVKGRRKYCSDDCRYNRWRPPPAEVGRAVVACPECGTDRWHGYGPCSTCGAPGTVGTNRAAAERTITAMHDSGVLEAVDDATVAAFLSLASAVDGPDAKADIWREYRAFSAALKEAAAGGTDEDSQAFLITVQTPRGGRAALGDTSQS